MIRIPTSNSLGMDDDGFEDYDDDEDDDDDLEMPGLVDIEEDDDDMPPLVDIVA